MGEQKHDTRAFREIAAECEGLRQVQMIRLAARFMMKTN